LSRQLGPVRPQQITAIELLGLGLLRGVRLPTQRPAGRIVADRVVPRHPRIALFQPPDRLADLQLPLEPTAGDPLLKPPEVRQESPLLLLANRSVLGRATRADAEHDPLLPVAQRLDPDRRLLLGPVAGRRRAPSPRSRPRPRSHRATNRARAAARRPHSAAGGRGSPGGSRGRPTRDRPPPWT